MTSESASRESLVRAVALGGGLLFAASLMAGLWAYAFVWDTPSSGGALSGTLVNVTLFTAFAFHHSLFARTFVKRWIQTIVAARLERSIYVWVASALFVALCVAWQPVGGLVWQVAAPWSTLLFVVQLAGVVLTLQASRQLDIWSLSGIRQAWNAEPRPPEPLVATGLYRLVRHPIYFAWVLMVWPTPAMTGTRFVFALVSTLYLAAAIPIEERSLRSAFGTDYDAYARRVRWRMVPFLY